MPGTRLAHSLGRVQMETTACLERIFRHQQPRTNKEKKMKKLALQLFVWATVIAVYVTPILACGGGGV
jgi:hypothetical protein